MKQLIGYFAVDSGQALIGDPCYLEEWKPWESDKIAFDEHHNKAGEYGYLGACNATLTKGYGELNKGSAVVFNTGHGDGMYPVYADIEDNVVQSITVNFIRDEEQD